MRGSKIFDVFRTEFPFAVGIAAQDAEPAARHIEQEPVGADVDGGWNFGPDEKDARTVLEAATKLAASLGRGKIVVEENPDAPHEAKLLRLDAGKAIKSLGWRPALGFDEGIEMTAAWYRAHHDGANARDLTLRQIEDYMRKAS